MIVLTITPLAECELIEELNFRFKSKQREDQYTEQLAVNLSRSLSLSLSRARSLSVSLSRARGLSRPLAHFLSLSRSVAREEKESKEKRT